MPFDASHSERLFESAGRVIANGVTSGIRRHATPIPLYFARAEGPYFWDVDGRRVLDYTLGWGPLIVGNNHPHVNAAVIAQLGRGYAFGAQHELEIRVARQVLALVPGVEQVVFSNSGTEAVQAAVRIARTKTGRSTIVKFEGHYHGWMNNVLVSYRPPPDQPMGPQPVCGGQPANELADTRVLPWNDFDALGALFERCGESIAAVIAEPLLANSGCIEPQPGFLQAVVDRCRQYGAVSIFDEIITGFRLAAGGAREYYDVAPDLSVYAKAIAGGFPLSAVAGRAEMFDVLRDGRTIHVGTYNGNPIVFAAASAVLELLAEPGVFERMHAHGRAICRTLETEAAALGTPLVTTGVGSVFGVHWGVVDVPRNYREWTKADMLAYRRFQAAMLEHGVNLLPDGRWYVGAAHDSTALELVTDAIRRSMPLVK